MGFMSRDGMSESLTPDTINDATGQSTLPANLNQTDPTLNPTRFQTDRLENYPIVGDPARDRQAFDTSQYPDSFRRLQAYMNGHRWKVTYFQQMGIQGDVRTNISDYPNEKNVIHTTYCKITDFEITLQGPLQWQYISQEGEGNALGQALFYSGFAPLKGDFFVGSVGDNKLGLFRISTVEALSWRNDRVHLVGFYFYNYADNGNLDFLEQATDQRKVFYKSSYLGGVSVLLEEDYYQDLQELKRFRSILAKHYYRLFYDDSLNTLRNPDGIYDPYLVKFMASACEYDIVKRRPQQLFRDTDLGYDYTIWSRLSDRVNTDISDLYPYWCGIEVTGMSNGIMLTPLVNAMTINVVGRDSTQAENGLIGGYYALGETFYEGDYENMTPLEQLVFTTIKERSLVDTATLLSQFLRQYLKLSNDEAFYTIPLYIKLIDVAIDSISRKVPSTPF